jgi:hypothetical protein
MTTNLSRRAAMASSLAALTLLPGAASAAAALTAPPPPNLGASLYADDREEWLALYRALCEADSRICPASNAIDRAEAAAKREYPKRPSRAVVAEIGHRHNLPALRAAKEAAWAAMHAAEEAIINKPANSIAGIAVKLAVWVHLDGEPPGLDETMDDAEYPTAVAVWRDALRLAGLPEGLGTRAYRQNVFGLGGDNG